jgi:hypothetical protein
LSKDSVEVKDLYYVNEKGLWKLPLSGGAEANVERGNIFVPAKDGIYYEQNHVPGEPFSPSFSLWFLDFKTQQQQVIGTPPGPLGWGNIDISPDSRSILYSKMDHSGSELMLVDNFR